MWKFKIAIPPGASGEAPNPDYQAPENHQSSITNVMPDLVVLELGIDAFFGRWLLVLEIPPSGGRIPERSG